MTPPLSPTIHPSADVSPHASIGAGTRIWHHCQVRAGAVVTRAVPDYGLVFGTPARLRGFVCPCGESLAPTGESADGVLMRCARGHAPIRIPRETVAQLHPRREARGHWTV